jgi:transposase
MKKRRTFTAEFKSKVALEALREQQPLHEIAKRYQVHASQVTEWKKEAKKGTFRRLKRGHSVML